MTQNEMPDAGRPAPSFTGVTGAGETLSLKDYRGRWLLLYFYPRDNTPGCTKQACNLRDNYEALLDAGVSIIGISDDSPEKHAEFSDDFDLPFPLIADTERSMLNDYGVYGEKNMYGVKRMGTKRTSFLIDPEGIIRHVFKRPKTGEHAEEVLKIKESVQG